MLGTVAFAGVVAVLVSLEVMLAALLADPGRAPRGFILDGLRSVYVRQDWSVIQTDPRLVAWDPGLTYLLRPGPSRFGNREFDTELRANSAGLRDDEASLAGPDLIVLGDSYSLGWGVEQEEAYPQILERRTGLSVLNASMSSFATAREVLLLRRLDTSRARAVIVQYFMNDFYENREFIAGGYALATRSRQDLARSSERFARTVRYRPFDYLAAFLDRRPFHPEVEAASAVEIAGVCLEVLDASDELAELPILLLQIDAWADPRHNVVDATAALLAPGGIYSDLGERLTLVRLEGVLAPEDFFLLDPHLRPVGHRKVAAAVAAALRARGLAAF